MVVVAVVVAGLGLCLFCVAGCWCNRGGGSRGRGGRGGLWVGFVPFFVWLDGGAIGVVLLVVVVAVVVAGWRIWVGCLSP